MKKNLNERNLYLVKQNALGRDAAANLYFETKEEAETYCKHDFTKAPKLVKFNDDDSFKGALINTMIALNGLY